MSFLRSKNMKAYELIVAKETENKVLDQIGIYYKIQEEWERCSLRRKEMHIKKDKSTSQSESSILL